MDCCVSVGLTWSVKRRSDGTLLVVRETEYLDLCGLKITYNYEDIIKDFTTIKNRRKQIGLYAIYFDD